MLFLYINYVYARECVRNFFKKFIFSPPFFFLFLIKIFLVFLFIMEKDGGEGVVVVKIIIKNKERGGWGISNSKIKI